MTSPTILLDHLAVKAASRIRAKNDLRYYLNGIFVEATKSQTLVVATDGHRLIVLRSAAENGLKDAVSLIIPADAARCIVDGSLGSLRQLQLTQLPDGKWQVPLLKWGIDMTFHPIAANYPDWRKVIPKSVSMEATNLNPKYVSDFHGAACDFYGLRNVRGPAVEVAQNGLGAALVFPGQPDENFLGVIMPVRGPEKSRTESPAWALAAAPKAIAGKYLRTTPSTSSPAEATA